MALTAPVMFPDRSQLDKSDDGTEYIYGGSVGINRILGYFHDNAYKLGREEWPLLLVNLFTVFRNVYHKDLSDLELESLVTLDCDLLTLYVEAYASARPHIRHTPGIVFYAPTYSLIPKELLRPLGPAAQVQHDAYLRFRRSLGDGETNISHEGRSFRWVVPVGSEQLPHRQLLRWLAASGARFEYIPGQDPVMLISHCPIDLHIASRLPTVRLMESYQGVIKHPTAFGSKLDVGDDVPFNPYTHRVFGDKVHLAPMVKGADKKALLAKAHERQWQRLPTSEILTDITKTVDIPASELIRVKF